MPTRLRRVVRSAVWVLQFAGGCVAHVCENPFHLVTGGAVSNVFLLLFVSYFFLGTRMRSVVNFGKVLEIEMGIHLRGGDAGVSEHFLHRAQVAGGLQHMGGEGVA